MATLVWMGLAVHLTARITFAHHDQPIARQGGGATSSIQTLQIIESELTLVSHAATCLPLVVHPVLFVHAQRHPSARFIPHEIVPQRLVRRNRLVGAQHTFTTNPKRQGVEQ